MKGKKFLAALLVASMLCPNSIIYASEASETEVETEVSEEMPVISEDNGIETSVFHLAFHLHEQHCSINKRRNRMLLCN